MTREEMARTLEATVVRDYSGFELAMSTRALRVAAAELRKVCATCQHFHKESSTAAFCLHDKAMQRVMYSTLADGSGFCHRHEAKP